MPDAEKPGWAAALGKIPSGLFVVTMATEQGETGLLASWVQQCSFDPPQVTLAFNRDRPVLADLRPGVPLGIHILPEGGKALVAHFGKGFAPTEDAFDGLTVVHRRGTAPRLSAALGWLDVRVVSRQEVGDHVLVVAKIVDGEVQHEGKPTVHIRRDGLRY